MFIKCSTDGRNGSGKSFTMAELAAGISKEFCDSRPVLAFDSEDRWRFLKALIFDVEKVPLIVVRGTSLAVLLDALAQARKAECAVFVGDQLTTPWMEALKSFSYENGELPFARRQQLMNQWDQMVRAFKGPFHALACGRLGYQWENVEDPETGEMKLLQGDSKFNAGGGSNFGYECELELEIRRKKNLVGKLFRRSMSVTHVVDVIKDVTTMLSGKQFSFPDTSGGYKAGGYKPVLEAVRPHIEFMRRVSGVAPVFDPAAETRTSADLLVGGRTPWMANQAERKALLEEIDGDLEFCFPGGKGESKVAAAFKKLTIEYLTGSLSWARLEDECPTDELGKCKWIIHAMRKRIEAKQVPNTQRELMTLLDLAKDDVYGGTGKTMTLLEAMLGRSVEQAKRGPQPVVRAMDAGEKELTGD